MAPEQTFVIVGASLAGAKAAETLRTEGFAGRVVSAHLELIQLLATGTKAEFLAATSEHLTLAHELAASVR